MTAKSIQLSQPTPDQAARFAPLIAELIWATGPVSYGYQFGDQGLLARIVVASWRAPDTLFAASATTLATDGDELVGLELGFAGPNFYVFKNNLVGLAGDLIAQAGFPGQCIRH